MLIATLISAILGEVIDAIAIALIVLVMAVFGFIQEYRSEKTIQALKMFTVPRCKVIREEKR